MKEVASSKTPYQIREHICSFAQLQDARLLWDTYQEAIIEDYAFRNIADPINAALLNVREIVRAQSNIWENFGLPPITDENPILEVVFNQEEERIKGDAYVATLNQQLRTIFDKLMREVNNNDDENRLFFMDGFAGSGKTYVFNTLLSVIRGRGEEYYCVLLPE